MPASTSTPNDAPPITCTDQTAIMNQASADSSPISLLPGDILADIFSLCVPSGSARMLTCDAPLLLCRVCSSWRDLALATPKIWTTVGLVICRRHTDVAAATHVITTWLKRSGALPLTLHLRYNPYDRNDPAAVANLDLIEAILSVFGSHSSRWRDVNLFLHETPPMLWPQLGDLPLLEAFHFDGRSQDVIDLTFNGSPRLTRLSGSYPVVALTNPRIPWSQISHLSISHRISPFDASEAIRLCPQLEEFQASLDNLGWDNRLPPARIVENHRLRRLAVTSACFSPLFSSLTLPSLRAIGLHTGDCNARIFLGFQSLLDLLTRSNCRLDSIGLYDCALSCAEVLQLFEHKSLEMVRALNFNNSRNQAMLTNDVLIRLTNFPPAHALLPKLTHLTLGRCVGLDVLPRTLGKMVHSRRCLWQEHGTEQLELFLLVTPIDVGFADDDLMRQAISDGLFTDFLIL